MFSSYTNQVLSSKPFPGDASEKLVFSCFQEMRKELSEIGKTCYMTGDLELIADYNKANEAFQEMLASHIRSML